MNIIKSVGQGTILIFSVIFLIAGARAFVRYSDGASDTEVEIYRTMLSDDTKTIAHINPDYTRSLFSFIKTYSCRYTFEVDGIVYEGVYVTRSLPEFKEITIYYLKSNPVVNYHNPVQLLEMELKKESMEQLIISIVLSGLGIIGIFFWIYRYFSKRKLIRR